MFSLLFFGFTLLVFSCSLLVNDNSHRFSLLLALVGIFFVFTFGWQNALIIVLLVEVNYWAIAIQERSTVQFLRKFVLFIMSLTNVLVLVFFKYFTELVNVLLQLSDSVGLGTDITVGKVLLPIGLSFIFFRLMAALYDTYHYNVQFQKRGMFYAYILYFPQLLSGPIMMPREFISEISTSGQKKAELGEIVFYLVSGFAKKWLIASILYATATDPFLHPSDFSGGDLILTVFAYGTMLYVDFSGYSDIAYAISLLFCIKSTKNFANPYKAIGLKQFWDSWHISLSTWFKNYVYTPLGAGEYGKFVRSVNVLIVMILSAIWHGFGLQYLAWGLLHGIGIIISYAIYDTIKGWSGRVPKIIAIFGGIIGWLLTISYVMLAWVFFASESIQSAVAYLHAVVNKGIQLPISLNYLVVSVVIMIIVFDLFGESVSKFAIRVLSRVPAVVLGVIFAVYIYIILRIGPSTVPPFIYFAF